MVPARRIARRSTHTDCAIPGAGASTGRTDSYGWRMSDKAPARKSIAWCAAEIMAGGARKERQIRAAPAVRCPIPSLQWRNTGAILAPALQAVSCIGARRYRDRSEEHTSELQSP